MKKTAVITGASSGIGLSLAELLSQSGFDVVCLARRECPLGSVRSIKTDVTDEASVKTAFESIERVDLLVCNAGMGISGAFEDTTLSDAKKQFDVNFFGAFLTVKYALPKLRESKGKVICLSSVAAVVPIPFQSFYSASKAAINTAVTALRGELKPFEVTVCAIMPGDAKTGFTAARVKSKAGSLYADRAQRSVGVMEKDEENGADALFIARQILRISQKKHPAPLYTAGAQYKLLVFLTRLLPHRFVSFFVNKIYA